MCLVCGAHSSELQPDVAYTVGQRVSSGEFGFGAGLVQVECLWVAFYTLFMGILFVQYIVSEWGHTGDTGMTWVVNIDALGQLTF